MRILTKMRRQAAIYWPPGGTPDSYGRPGVGPLVELTLQAGGNYRVRWEAVVEEYRSADGTVLQSAAKVYCPRLPDGSEVQVGGWLWLGAVGGLASTTVPQANPGAYPVKRFDMLPTFRGTKWLRCAWL